MLAAMAKDSIIYNHDGMELPVDDWKHRTLFRGVDACDSKYS